jgi:putative sugar O-methyltransferase
MLEFNLIKDDEALLELMLKDARKEKDIYQPGPYWRQKTKNAVNELRRCGLSDFRGSNSGVAISFGDNVYVDTRNSYNSGLRSLFRKIYKYIPPFNRIFDSQVTLTKSHFTDSLLFKNIYLQNNQRVKALMKKYELKFDTTKGGCVTSLDVNGRRISHYYLELLNTLDRVQENVKISGDSVYFEIGGGFGVNVHLLIELFGLKKIIYLDIPPNLYVGTQYLKTLYGNNVIDYRENRGKVVQFSKNDNLEIFCITPPQIESINAKIDLFHNAHSFVEMPEAVVTNYLNHISKLLNPNTGVISLVSYDGFNLNETIHPDRLPSFYNGTFQKKSFDTLYPLRSEYHYIIRNF